MEICKQHSEIKMRHLPTVDRFKRYGQVDRFKRYGCLIDRFKRYGC